MSMNKASFVLTLHRGDRRRSTRLLDQRSGSSTRFDATASPWFSWQTLTVTRDAPYKQAGVIAVGTHADLTATVAVLSKQSVPSGLRTVILTNAAGGGVLAADACAHEGLHVAPPSFILRAALTSLLPATASLRNAIDTTAAVSADTFARCLRAAMDDATVDAVLAITVPTALGDPAADIAEAAAKARAGGQETLVVAVNLTQRESLRLLGDAVPSFAEPAVAVAALAHATHYGQWRRRPTGLVPALAGIAAAAALTLVDGFLAEHADRGWLSAPEVTKLLRRFEIPTLEVIAAADEDEAVAAFRGLPGRSHSWRWREVCCTRAPVATSRCTSRRSPSSGCGRGPWVSISATIWSAISCGR